MRIGVPNPISAMLKFALGLSLRTQLLIVMLAMIILSVGSITYLQNITEDRIFDLMEEQIKGLTEAIGTSVEQITTEGDTNSDRLRNYFSQLRKSGIEEVSILSSQQEVIQSSNPKVVGTKVDVDKNEMLLVQKIAGDEKSKPQKMYSAFVPVVSKGNLEGYIQIRMYFDNLENLNRGMLYRRTLWTLAIFSVGVLLCIFISYQYTKPIPILIEAIRSIAQGKMPQLPAIPHTDINTLAVSLKDMIHKMEERKILEEKLNRAEQQAMVAQLASGIAHEIRNPLNFISLFVDHLNTLKSTTGISIDADLIQKTKLEIRRVNQMVMNFLDLGRELVLHRIKLKADLIVEDALGLCRMMLSDRGIKVLKSYCEPMPEIDIDIDRMKSCFQNLIQNAADAMPHGGTLTLFIENQDRYLDVMLKDTGEGIRPDDLPRVYEPYFTTKKTGIGLGMAIAKRMVEAHGGGIAISSEPGKGTCVRVSIPKTGGGL
jgi:signal transduction histidine kinase